MRTALQNAARIVVKVGSSSLTRPVGGLDPARVDALVDVLAGRPGSVLVSSGAIAAGLPSLGLDRRPRDLATLQAAAAIGQGLLVARYAESFARYDRRVGQVLLTADDVIRRAHYRNAERTLNRLLDLGLVPIVNENDTVATEEIRFGDNDRLAALVAHLVRADALVLLSDVSGVHDDDPRRPGARLVAEVRSGADLHGVSVRRRGSAIGTGGMATKLEAARLATEAGVPVVVAHAEDVAGALAGAEVGTYFHPTGSRKPARLLWLANAAAPRGRLVLDAGAVAAVVDRRLSLLPAGIVAVDGNFVAGDPVDVAAEDGRVVARGLVEYDAGELPPLLGRSTRELAAELGPAYSREVIHRDGMVVLRPAGRIRPTAAHRGRVADD